MPTEHYSTILPRTGDTRRILLGKILYALLGGGGGGGGTGANQIVPYTGIDPNSDGVLPGDITMPAIAVKPGESTWTWTTPAGPWA